MRCRERPPTVLDSYHAGLAALADANADAFLTVLAEYGRRWQVFVEVDVPIGQRFRIRTADDRPLNLISRGTSRQRFALGDASSGHLEVRVRDHSVRLHSMSLRDLCGDEIGPGLIEAHRLTSEAGSIYSSLVDRPPLVDVDVRFGLRPHVIAVPVSFVVVACAACLTATLLPTDDALPTKLGVLAVPITITAALLVVPEQSALATRMQRWPRRLVLIFTMLLWAAVVVRLLLLGIDMPPW